MQGEVTGVDAWVKGRGGGLQRRCRGMCGEKDTCTWDMQEALQGGARDCMHGPGKNHEWRHAWGELDGGIYGLLQG